MIKKLSMVVILAMLFSVMSFVAAAAPVPVTLQNVWFNGREVLAGEIRGDILRGDTLEVEVKLLATATSDNVRVAVDMQGDDRAHVDERTEAFSTEAGKVYYKKVTLHLPDNLDLRAGSEYIVHIEISNRRDDRVTREIVLNVDTPRHAVEITDVIFNPGLTVEAGRSLLASVRVKNNGEKDEENVKVALTLEGISSDADYLDEIQNDKEKQSEQLYVAIPVCTEEGRYKAVVSVDYDDNTRKAVKEFDVNVLGSDRCAQTNAAAQPKTAITLGPESQNIVAGGSEAAYLLTVTNAGKESRTYTVQLTTGDWAESRLSSNVLVVNPGETKVVYAYVKAKKDASAGDKLLSVSVSSGGETLKEVTLRANVVEQQKAGPSASLRQGFEVGLVVLVVLLLIVGLIVGFSRLKGEESGKDKDDETYY